MSVFNHEKYLQKSIDSILSQSYKNFEFIIINDGSNKNTKKILELNKLQDKRIKVIINKKRIGLTKSLNIAIKISKGEYIARQDSDDISYFKRFEEQLNFFKKNKKVIMCGTNGILIDNNGSFLKNIKNLENNYEKIKKKLIYENQFIHSSVMVKRNYLLEVKGYDEKFKYAQDYDLWCRLSIRGFLTNINKILVKIRQHNESITKKNKKEQNYYSILASIRHYAEINNLKYLNKSYDIYSFLKEKKIVKFAKILIFLNRFNLPKNNKIKKIKIYLRELYYFFKFKKLIIKYFLNYLRP
jgi:glycosyltransferase involved in cell wall biosynthesis